MKTTALLLHKNYECSCKSLGCFLQPTPAFALKSNAPVCHQEYSGRNDVRLIHLNFEPRSHPSGRVGMIRTVDWGFRPWSRTVTTRWVIGNHEWTTELRSPSIGHIWRVTSGCHLMVITMADMLSSDCDCCLLLAFRENYDSVWRW